MTINTNPQVWILTTYGIRRISEVIASPTTERLYVSKIKIGDANGTYYTPSQGVNNDLKNPITGGEFPIVEKSVDDTTVTFRAIIPETSGGYDIREIALYETINNVDTCIALGTCEPIVKPAYDTNEHYGYAMSIDYKLNINSVNLATVYDQIELDPDNEYVKQDDLESLARTVLFVEGNLMDQISNNTHILGLNRAQQLSELIDESRTAFADSALLSLYGNLINAIDDSYIRGFWGFNYTEKFDSVNAVKDFSSYGNNLSLNKTITKFDSGLLGIAPYLDFTTSDYFKAPYISSLKMTGAFSIIFAGQFNTLNTNKVILAQAITASPSSHNWSLSADSDNKFVFNVYTDESNYISFTTGDDTVPSTPFSVAVTFDGIDSATLYINGEKQTLTKTSVGTFTTLAVNNLETASYIPDLNGQPANVINAKTSFLSLISTNLSQGVIRAMSLYLKALLGRNIYRGN